MATQTSKTNDTKRTLRTVPTTTKKNVAPEKIQKMIETRAFELYQRRGNKNGTPEGDWLTAENQILKELGLR